MESSTIETKFQSLLSLDKDVTDPKLKFVLLIHSINLAYDLKCTGLNEDDPEIEKDLPSNWKKDIDGIYSFRYSNPKDKNVIYLKVVVEGDLVDVNAVTAAKDDELITSEFKLFDYPELNSENINKIYKKYKTELLSKLLAQLKPKQEEKKSDDNRQRIYDERSGIFWNVPRNDNQFPRVIGDGRNDIYPGPANPFGVPPHGHFVNPRNPNIFPNLYGDQPRPGGPNVQFDPLGPNGIDPSTPDPDIEFPPRPFTGPNLRGPFGGTGGPFGGGFSGPGGLI